jgi:hypothetical protein
VPKPQLDGYPRDIIGKRFCVGTHVGPASYTAITVASPPTGGDTLYAKEFGLKAFDSVAPLSSDNGQYGAVAVFPEGITKGSTSCKLLWKTLATGAEVAPATNLSARTLRILVVGD